MEPHANLGAASGSLTENLPAHGSRLFTFTPKNAAPPPAPRSAVHGTASTARQRVAGLGRR